jgi:hypothetical protein
MKRFLYIDTEFNGYKGQLMSMGIVSDSLPQSLGRKSEEFYCVRSLGDDVIIDPWVKENVQPHLFNGKRDIKDPESHPTVYAFYGYDLEEFQQKLESFLQKFEDGFVIVADWPDDIRYFCESLITAPGKMIDIPDFEIKVVRTDYLYPSRLPHNALEDARALKKTIERMHDFRLY